MGFGADAHRTTSLIGEDQIGHHQHRTISSSTMAMAEPWASGCHGGGIKHEQGGDIGGEAHPRPGHGHDQIKDLQRDMPEDDDRAEGDGVEEGTMI